MLFIRGHPRLNAERKVCAMKSLIQRLLVSTAIAMVSLGSFNGSAMAASTSAKLAHKSRGASPKQHRVAQSLCARPLKFSPQQLIPAMLGLPLIPGPNDALVIDGVRVPIGDCGPSATDPYTGEAVDNRPTQSGSAWIARMKRNNSRKSSGNP
jgi:hypothetical protein